MIAAVICKPDMGNASRGCWGTNDHGARIDAFCVMNPGCKFAARMVDMRINGIDNSEWARQSGTMRVRKPAMCEQSLSPTLERHEDFPVSSLCYLEGKLSRLRTLLMARAAEIAAQSTANSPVYRVEQLHVDQAAGELFRHAFPVQTDLEHA